MCEFLRLWGVKILGKSVNFLLKFKKNSRNFVNFLAKFSKNLGTNLFLTFFVKFGVRLLNFRVKIQHLWVNFSLLNCINSVKIQPFAKNLKLSSTTKFKAIFKSNLRAKFISNFENSFQKFANSTKIQHFNFYKANSRLNFANFSQKFTHFALVFAAAFFLNACFSSNGGEVGKPAPQISAKNLAGEAVSLPKDKIVVLVFFENGCKACLQELPLLDSFAAQNADKLAVIGIDSVDEMPTLVVLKERLSLYNIVLAKDDLDLSWQRYSIFALPTTIIIKDGLVVERLTGDKPWQELHSKLLHLL